MILYIIESKVRFRKKGGVQMGMGYRVRKWTDDDREKIKQLYIRGETLVSISKLFNVSPQTISLRLKEMGLKK